MASIQLPNDLLKAVKDGRALIVVGPGIHLLAYADSKAAWPDILLGFMDRLAEEPNKESPAWKMRKKHERDTFGAQTATDLYILGQRIINEVQPGDFARWLRGIYGELQPKDPDLLKLLVGLKSPIVSLNFDISLASVNFPPIDWADGNKVTSVLNGIDKSPIHIRGHWKTPLNMIVGSSALERYKLSETFQTLKKASTIFSTIIFIGMETTLPSELPEFETTISDFASERKNYLIHGEFISPAILAEWTKGSVFPLQYGPTESLSESLRAMVTVRDTSTSPNANTITKNTALTVFMTSSTASKMESNKFPFKNVLESIKIQGFEPVILREDASLSELLKADETIVFTSDGDILSEYFSNAFDLLSWREALGMRLTVIPGDKATETIFRQSKFAFLGKNLKQAWSPSPDVEKKLAIDPILRWSADVATLLADLPQERLVHLGRKLGFNSVMGATNSLRREIASRLLTAQLTDVHAFVRQAAADMEESGTSTAKRTALLHRSLPLWVDLRAGRVILHASQLPADKRLCAANVKKLEWAEHVVRRATAGSVDYCVSRLPAVAGEVPVAELFSTYEETLLSSLNLPPTATPEQIGALILRFHSAVFVVLDCDGLPSETRRKLSSDLAARFPGITLLLVDSETPPDWTSFPDIGIAVPPGSFDESEVVYHLNSTRALLKE
jgi:hypothetical protein